MDTFTKLPATFKPLQSVSAFKPPVRPVQPPTVEGNDVAYITDPLHRFGVVKATADIIVSLYAAMASEWVDGAAEWNVAATGDAKARAKVATKNATAAVLEHYNAVLKVDHDAAEAIKVRKGQPEVKPYKPLTKLPASASAYLSTFARGAQFGVSVIAAIEDGKVTRLKAWAVYLAELKAATADAPKETATECLTRLAKAYESHRGSRVDSGAVGADALLPLLSGIVQAIGVAKLRSMADAIAAEIQAAQPAQAFTIVELTSAEAAIVAQPEVAQA